jgi:hypothetical protein
MIVAPRKVLSSMSYEAAAGKTMTGEPSEAAAAMNEAAAATSEMAAAPSEMATPSSAMATASSTAR